MKNLTQYINESVGGIKILPLINLVAMASGHRDFTDFNGFVNEIESQDWISFNDDFEDENEFCNFVLAHKNDIYKWEYEFDYDGYYSIWTEAADGKTIQLMIWDDDIAEELDEKFDGEVETGDDKYDKAFMKLVAKNWKNIPDMKI